MLQNCDTDDFQNYTVEQQQEPQPDAYLYTMDHSYESSNHQIIVDKEINSSHESNASIEENYNNDEYIFDSPTNNECETIKEMVLDLDNEEHISNDNNTIHIASSDHEQSESALNLPDYNYEYLKSDSDEEIELKYNFTESVDNVDHHHDNANADIEPDSQLSKPLQIQPRNASKNFTKTKYVKRKFCCTKSCHQTRLLQSTKLFRMQIEILKAKKQKLLEETAILRLTKEKLIVELDEIRRNAI